MSQAEERRPSEDASLSRPSNEARLPLYQSPRVTPRLTDRRGGLVARSERGSTPDLFVLCSNRLGYGPTSGQKAEWNALGASQEARFTSYINQQLDPGSIVDTDYQSRRTAAGYVTLDKSLHELWIEYERDLAGVTDSNDPQEECELDWFLRAIYSKRQLEQVMTEFWVDHFNINSRESPTDSLWPSWVELLRSNAFGNFRSLLGQTAEHTTMLYYLDQYTSSFAGPNENYCRELFELHTLGAENYLGVVPQTSVGSALWSSYAANLSSVFPTGIPDGYVDNDVFQAAQAFSGWTYRTGDSTTPGELAGEFFFDSARQPNTAQMTVLGFGVTNIPSTTPPPQRGRDILDLLAFHPGTARHVCRKLVRKFVQDDPPQSLVDSAADVFIAQRDAADQLKQVMLHILTSNEFRNSFGAKIKRPFGLVVSMLRATKAHFDWTMGGDQTGGFMYRFERTGHRPFRWRPPDGYPDVREKWETASPRVMSWRLGQWLCAVRDTNTNLFMPINARTPGSVARTPNALVDYWLNRIFARPMSFAYREEVVDFLGQGFNPDSSLNLTATEVEERLQMMMALIMATPEFCER